MIRNTTNTLPDNSIEFLENSLDSEIFWSENTVYLVARGVLI